MAYFNTHLQQGSWEELIPAISFNESLQYSSYQQTIDDSWRTLAACSYQSGQPSFTNEMAENDNDLGYCMYEETSSPMPPNVTVSDQQDAINVSPASSISSGFFSCSDYDALSPLRFDYPTSPETSRQTFDQDSFNSYHGNSLYSTSPSMEHMTINQRLLSYAVPRTNLPQNRPTMDPNQAMWSFPFATQSFNDKVKPEKPPLSYIALISKAILSMDSRKALLSDIYSFALENYDYYRTANKTWKNAVRHNLSINECFIKNGRAPQGRGYYWSIHPACLSPFLKGDFRRREARQLAVDMDNLRKRSTSVQDSSENVSDIKL